MAPAGKQASLSTLIFHRVLPEPDPLFPGEMHARQFDAVCGWLKSWLNVLPLDQAVTLLKAGKLPARAACITFDDGYADNHDVAMPILRRHGLPATFFIATGFLDGGRMWNDTIIESVRDCEKATLDLTELGLGRQVFGTVADRRVAIDALIGQIKYRPVDERLEITEAIARLAGASVKPALMMSSEQVKAMHRSGMQIGAHTVSHPILMKLSDQQALVEIAQSKTHLEQLLGDSVGLFAYPNGRPNEDFNQATVELVRAAGFDAAVTTENGISRASDDIFRLRRFTPWDQSQWRFGGRLLSNLRRH
jgi:peptidoglycan/xylan/chitin deacetylase (PgdA/CDA1 family)